MNWRRHKIEFIFFDDAGQPTGQRLERRFWTANGAQRWLPNASQWIKDATGQP